MRRLAALFGLALVIGVGLPVQAATSASAATPGPAGVPEYWFDQWRVPQLWSDGARGQGITIAEIDTGVNASLPQLRGRILPGTDLGAGGDGQIDRDESTFGHGTAMASIMVARPSAPGVEGLAPGARVLPIAVPLVGTSDQQTTGFLPQAIDYAADHGAKIISMSLGGKRDPDQSTDPCPPAEQAAVFHAIRQGAILIAAVGNTGATGNAVEEPGVCLGVVSVGAVDSAGDVAFFSGRQPYLTLVAPGVAIASLGRLAGQAFDGEGTSQATALTAATAALVWSKYPTLSGRAVVTRLLATLDAHRTTPSNDYGYGVLNAYRAVTAQVPASAPNPVYDLAEPFLGRDTAFTHSQGGVPDAARTQRGGLGSYAVGSRSRLERGSVVTGLALAAAGLLLVVLVLVLATRRRRVPEHVSAEMAANPVDNTTTSADTNPVTDEADAPPDSPR